MQQPGMRHARSCPSIDQSLVTNRAVTIPASFSAISWSMSRDSHIRACYIHYFYRLPPKTHAFGEYSCWRSEIRWSNFKGGGGGARGGGGGGGGGGPGAGRGGGGGGRPGRAGGGGAS